jgi:hypothetical protein
LDKRKHSDLQNTTQTTKDRATQTLLRPKVNSYASDG